MQPVSGQIFFRLAKPSYGPMNPPKRAHDGNRAEWGRFDIPGEQTLYGAVPEEAAYAESLANFRVSADIADTRVQELFEHEPFLQGRKSLESVIQDEWRKQNHMDIGKLPSGWRDERAMYELTLPESGWLIDITHSESLAALNRECRPLLNDYRLAHITSGELLGVDRGLTTRISEWAWSRTLEDGSLPHGILFPSKHGDDFTCVAIYLRALGDGKHVSAEPTTSDAGHGIEPPSRNPALKRVTRMFDLKCW